MQPSLQKLQQLQETFTNLCIENREEERELSITNRAKEEYLLRQIKQEINEVISASTPSSSDVQPTTSVSPDRSPSEQFPDKRGDGISIGDNVWVLSTATASFPGDLAVVTSFGKRKVHIKILRGFRKGHKTTRNSENLLIDKA